MPSYNDLQNEMEKIKQTIEEITSKLADSLKDEEMLRDKVSCLEKKLETDSLIHRIRNNDKMTQYFTGLKSWELFEIIFQLLLPGITYFSALTKKSLPYIEQFLLVLMRLRLNLGLQDLAYRFRVTMATVSNYISKWIDIMYFRLARNFMVWPDNVANELSMPNYFRRRFPKCKVIIDCFEVPIERYKNLLARSSTYSYYKGKNTIKYMIGISRESDVQASDVQTSDVQASFF